MAAISVAEKSALLAPSAYMQMVGIVQSLAMYFLLTEATLPSYLSGKLPANTSLGTEELCLAALQTTVAFFLIVLTWHVNTQNITTFKRVFGLSDSFIPFFFVFTEFFVAVYSTPGTFEGWELSIAAFMLMAVFAYTHLFYAAKHEFFEEENKRLLSLIGRYTFWIRAYVVSSGLIVFFGWLFDVLPEIARASIIFVLLFIFTFLHRKFFWQRLIKGTANNLPNSCNGSATSLGLV
jgi:hypothetical protein